MRLSYFFFDWSHRTPTRLRSNIQVLKNGLIAINFRLVGNREVKFWFARQNEAAGAADAAAWVRSTAVVFNPR